MYVCVWRACMPVSSCVRTCARVCVCVCLCVCVCVCVCVDTPHQVDSTKCMKDEYAHGIRSQNYTVMLPKQRQEPWIPAQRRGRLGTHGCFPCATLQRPPVLAVFMYLKQPKHCYLPVL